MGIVFVTVSLLCHREMQSHVVNIADISEACPNIGKTNSITTHLTGQTWKCLQTRLLSLSRRFQELPAKLV
jgi:hypothetical protein